MPGFIQRYSICVVLSLILLGTGLRIAAAQDEAVSIQMRDNNASAAVEPQPNEKIIAWRDVQLWMTIGIVAFSGLLFILQFFVMFKSGKYWTDRQFKAFTLTLILTIGMLLIIAGFSDSQIAPMMGLIGTIAGYILGSGVKEKRHESKEPQPPA